MGLERRDRDGYRPLRTPALRRPWFIRIERMGVNEHDATARAFVEARRVLRAVRSSHNDGAKISAPADVASKGALAHCPKGAESSTVCLYSRRSAEGSARARPMRNSRVANPVPNDGLNHPVSRCSARSLARPRPGLQAVAAIGACVTSLSAASSRSRPSPSCASLIVSAVRKRITLP